MLVYSNLSDLELVSLLKEGDRLAYTEIYNRFRGLLYIFAFKLLKDEDNAADVVQEVFINLWDRRERLNLQGSVSSYLYAAVRYKFLNRLDHQKVHESYQASFDGFMMQGNNITDDYIRERELSKLIENEIANLPKKMREVFELSRTSALSQKQIATVLNISEKTVKTQIYNAVKILKVKFGALLFLFFNLCYPEIPLFKTLINVLLKKH